MLVPEISLTPQTVDRFISRFGEDKIAVLHSKLSIGERYDQWNKIKKGQAKIVIGARSAIFAPIDNLGLIVIDEEHDSSYKSESSPRYNAKELAELKKERPEDFKRSRYYEYFKDYCNDEDMIYTSGFDLLEKVRKADYDVYSRLHEDASTALRLKYNMKERGDVHV